MTADSFAPYGFLIDAPAHPAGHRTLTPMDFQSDGETTVNVIWQPQAKLKFSKLERHYGVTQTFLQLSGAPAVVCVAAPTDLNDESAVPDPADVRAFLIDPAKGFAFSRGTWHSLDRYILQPPGATFVILNVEPNPTQMVDYASGETVIYRNLDADPKPRRYTLDGEFGFEFSVDAS